MPRKYVLDGARKINVNLGPCNGQHQYWQALGVSMYYVENFPFHEYFAASRAQRNEMLLAVLEASLLDIASRFGADPAPIEQAIAATRASGCERRYLIPRLAKSTRSRRLKLHVFRHIRHGGEAWGVDITNRQGEVLETRWIAEKTNVTDASFNYRQSKVVGDEFIILGTLGEVTYRLDMKSLEESLIND